jgi:hypothetical protein
MNNLYYREKITFKIKFTQLILISIKKFSIDFCSYKNLKKTINSIFQTKVRKWFLADRRQRL